MTFSSDILEALLPLSALLENSGIVYCVGGSVASSVHGMPRSTVDIDALADLREEHVAPLAEALAGEYYIDAETILQSLRRSTPFNLIHLGTMIKVDVFLPRARDFERQVLRRCVRHRLGNAPGGEVFLTAAEDIVLLKLDWYQDGGSVSERQWLDVQGVLKMQAGNLDLEYLHKTAEQLGVNDLLAEALQQAAPA